MKTKKLVAIALSLCVTLVPLAGCKKRAADSTPAASVSAPQEPTGEIQQISANNLSGCSELIGVVDVYTGDTLTAASASEGTEYTFSLAGAELRCMNGAKMGDSVTVFYTGTLVGSGVENVDVVLVVDNAAKAA
ncbi:MAG: hypothetical protein RR215_06905, partial [Ruthenibacterium sp.]